MARTACDESTAIEAARPVKYFLGTLVTLGILAVVAVLRAHCDMDCVAGT